MKKLAICFLILTISCKGYSQTCEQRESKLLETLGGFSAGFLYNTYGVIGGVADGFTHDAYDVTTVGNLMDAQEKMMDNLTKIANDLKAGNFLKDKADVDYINSLLTVIAGLKKQAKLLNDYATKTNTQTQSDYAEMRKKNWKDISKLMGIDE